MRRTRVLLTGGVAAALLGLTGCASTVPGTATAAGTTTSAPSTSAPSSSPPSSAPSSSSSAPSSSTPSPTIADQDYDVQAMCLFLNLGFIPATSSYLDWQAATAAGTEPLVPATEVADSLDTAVTTSQPFVAEAPEGPPRTAGQAVLDQAGALAAALRAGGGQDGTAYTAAFDQLDAACPD